MRACFLLAGFAGTELGTGDGGEDGLWVDYSALARGKVGRLRLAADGTSPGEPDGLVCTPRNPLRDYFGVIFTTLRDGLRPHDYAVGGWGYDWRLPIRSQGALLAQAIRGVATAADPASVVAHSQGGLVARAAWSDLVETGEQAKLRRIVTMGTAHRGTYAAVSLWSGFGDLIEQLANLTALVSVVLTAAQPFGLSQRWSKEELIRLTQTWPALYELLPVVTPAELVDDPERAAIFDSGNWPSSTRPSQAWLDHARNDFHVWLRSAGSLPPPHVLTTVAGEGYPTPDVLVRPELLGQAGALSSTEAGDGTVTTSSALAVGGARFRLVSAHSGLPRAVALAGDLVEWVLEERSPATPPAEDVHLTSLAGAELAGPPAPVALRGAELLPRPFAGGACPGLTAAARRPLRRR